MSDNEGQQVGRVSVFTDGEGKFPWLSHFRIREGIISHLAALPRGTVGGKASVLVLGKLKDGSYAYLQTSLRIMMDAVTQWRAIYGIEGDGLSPAEHNEATKARVNAAILVKLVSDREGKEVTINIDELNAIMQTPLQHVEVAYGEDGKSLTLRLTQSD